MAYQHTNLPAKKMTNKSKVILIIVVVGIIVFLAGLWFSKAQKTILPIPKETVKVGVILPLTGASAHMGESVKKAILLAEEQLFLKRKYDYQVIFEDDEMDITKTSTALSKLVNIDKVDIVVSFTSGPGNVVTPANQDGKFIHFGIASDPEIAKGRFNFIHWTPPQAQVEKFIEEIKKKGIKRMAFIGFQQKGAVAVWEMLKKELQKLEVEVTAEEWFAVGTRDFKTMILKIKQSNPEIVYISTFSPELEILAKQIKELRLDAPLTSIEAFEYTQQPELFEGYWYIQAGEPKEDFISVYQNRYGEIPDIGAANGYDIFNLIADGFEEAGKGLEKKPSLEQVVNQLYQITNFSGALGKLTIPESGIIWSGATVKMIKNGKPAIISD